MIEIISNSKPYVETPHINNSDSGRGFSETRGASFEELLESSIRDNQSKTEERSPEKLVNETESDSRSVRRDDSHDDKKRLEGDEKSSKLREKNPESREDDITGERSGAGEASVEKKETVETALKGGDVKSPDPVRTGADSLKSTGKVNLKELITSDKSDKSEKNRVDEPSAAVGVFAAADLMRSLSELIKKMKSDEPVNEAGNKAGQIIRDPKGARADLEAEIMKRVASLKNALEESLKGSAPSGNDRRLISMAADLMKKTESAVRERLSGARPETPLSEGAMKEIAGKLAVMAETVSGMRNEKSSEKGSESASDSGNRFSFGFLKDDGGLSAKRIVPAAAVSDTARFNENFGEVLDRARISVRDSRNADFSLKLNPKEMGSVSVNLGLEQGILHAKFIVENESARDLLLANLNIMKEKLSEEGIELGSFQVDINGRGKESHESGESEVGGETVPFQERETAAVEYEAAQAIRHTGSLNLVI